MLPEPERLEALEIASAITKTLSGKPGSDLSESSRVDALEAARKLQNTLEKPGDGMLKVASTVRLIFANLNSGLIEFAAADSLDVYSDLS